MRLSAVSSSGASALGSPQFISQLYCRSPCWTPCGYFGRAVCIRAILVLAGISFAIRCGLLSCVVVPSRVRLVARCSRSRSAFHFPTAFPAVLMLLPFFCAPRRSSPSLTISRSPWFLLPSVRVSSASPSHTYTPSAIAPFHAFSGSMWTLKCRCGQCSCGLVTHYSSTYVHAEQTGCTPIRMHIKLNAEIIIVRKYIWSTRHRSFVERSKWSLAFPKQLLSHPSRVCALR